MQSKYVTKLKAFLFVVIFLPQYWLSLPQMGRIKRAATIKPFKHQSTFQTSRGHNLEEEKVQMGRRHDCGRQTMDN
jgi:hypothetical protein